MASPSTSSAPAIPPKYEYLKSLCDIQTIRDLTEDAVRDILRNKTNDHGLEVVEMGQISDMSGLNDAFNSTICSLKVKAKFSGKGPSAAAAGSDHRCPTPDPALPQCLERSSAAWALGRPGG